MRRHDFVESKPREPLDDQSQAAVGQLEHLVDVGRGADGVQVRLGGFVDRRVALREHRDQLAVGNRVVDEPHGALAGDGQRHERIGKEDRVAKREDRQLGWNRERPIADRGVLGFEVLDLIAHLGDLTWLSYFSELLIAGLPEAEGFGLRHRRSPINGTPILHVEEERGRAAPRVGLTLPLFRVFLPLLAVLAAHGEGQGTQPFLADFVAALEAVAVIALFRRLRASLTLFSVSDFIWISANSSSS